MLPGRDGYGVFRELRRDSRTSNTPVIMLTARAQTEDRIQGLEAGADDYLTKPFSPKELMLRVQAILKRVEGAPGNVDLTFGPFRFDKNALKFYLENEPVDLTSTEFKLLLFLCERPGKTQDRNDLLRSVWGYSDATFSRTLDTHMKRLRQKLGPYGTMIETIRGIGYCIAKTDA
jgi:two-component system phosphate regulon response regulator PhoB